MTMIRLMICTAVVFVFQSSSVAQAQVRSDEFNFAPESISVPQTGFTTETQVIPEYRVPERRVQVVRPLPPVQYQRMGFAVIPPRVSTFGPFWFSHDVGWCPRCGGYHPIPRQIPVYLPRQ